MITHAVILSVAKDLLADNTKPTPQLQSLRCSLYPTSQSIIFNVILSAAKDLIARNTIDKHSIDLDIRHFVNNNDQAKIVTTLTNTLLW